VLPIKVIPAAIDFLKATILVKTMALDVNFEASDKLNEAGIVIRPTCFCGTYAESKPTLPFVKAYLTGACIRVPGGQQIRLVAERKTTVA
jgi:hypothetical protein